MATEYGWKNRLVLAAVIASLIVTGIVLMSLWLAQELEVEMAFEPVGIFGLWVTNIFGWYLVLMAFDFIKEHVFYRIFPKKSD